MASTVGSWLVNQSVGVRIAGREGQVESFSKIIGSSGKTLIITVPMRLESAKSGIRTMWPDSGSRLTLRFSPNGSGQAAEVSAVVGSRRLKPVPCLELSVEDDISAVAVNLARPFHTICVASGKGGVGKTTLTINLGTALASFGRKVVLVDGDLGTANIAPALGLVPEYGLGDLVGGSRSLNEVLLRLNYGLALLPGVAGRLDLVNMSPWQFGRLVGVFASLEERFEYIIIDCASGIWRGVTNFLAVSDELLLVVGNSHTSQVDAYSLLKSAVNEGWSPRVSLVANMQESDEGQRVAQRFCSTARMFIRRGVAYLGNVTRDPAVEEALLRRRTLFGAATSGKDGEAMVNSSAARDILRIARIIDQRRRTPAGQDSGLARGSRTGS